LVTADNLEELLRKKLEKTGFFGARFRENAGRALLLPRGGFKKRMPLWLNRLRSKKLLDAVLRYDNFPVLVETWRGCLNDEFDLKNLKMLLDELRTGEVSVDEVHTKTPSPFARGLIWQQTQKHMYEGDTPHAPGTSRLSDDLYREVAFSSHLRPGIGRDQIRRFQEKLQRTASGYSPGTALELLEWVKERILIPVSEWEKLIISMEHDLCKDRDNVLKPVSNKLTLIKLPGSAFPSVIAVESIPKLLKALDLDHSQADETPGREAGETSDEKASILENIVGEWLFYYGPVEQSYLTEVFGLDTSLVSEILEVLSGNKSVVIDRLTEGAAVPEVCDSQNLEYLLRLIRAGSRPAFKALDARYLPLFLAELHCLTDRGDSISDLQAAFDKLFGYPADARLWETEFFPSRLKHYFSSWLDTLMQQNELMWFGCGRERVSFCFESDYELFMFNENTEIEDRAPGIKELFPDERGRFSFRDILDYSGISTQKLTDLLWEKTWKGEIFNDSWGSVRKGILTGFKGQDVTGNGQSGRRGKINRWKTSSPISGSWYPPGYKPQEPDIIEEEELIKDRVRQLLQRYGILFRELLDRELSFMKWPEVFRTLRIMELSGEVLGGHFFSGISGLQFISHRAFRLLKNGLSEDAVYWMNACDPVSICGVKLEGLPYRLPSRLSSNHLIFHGPNLVLVSRKKGREVQFFVPPADSHIMKYLDFFKTLINRDFMPEPDIKVEKINGLPVDRSPYRGIFISFGFKKGYRYFVLRRAFS
ncbi:MAG: ATP-dependent helicase, partial [Spirochaetes bacterium]|nr:ATP-dependent helicase [Spirochaetota bacterium]